MTHRSREGSTAVQEHRRCGQREAGGCTVEKDRAAEKQEWRAAQGTEQHGLWKHTSGSREQPQCTRVTAVPAHGATVGIK